MTDMKTLKLLKNNFYFFMSYFFKDKYYINSNSYKLILKYLFELQLYIK